MAGSTSRLLKRLALTGAALVTLVVGFLGVSYGISDVPDPIAKTVSDDPELPALEVGGVRLHVSTYGDPADPVIIALHGGPGDDFKALLPLVPLSEDYFLVLYDQRGSGLSERVPDAQLTYEAMLGELAAIIEHYSPDRPVRLIGHSWGAMLVSGYLGRHPDRVERAVLAEPGFLTPEAGVAFLEKAGQMPPVSFTLLREVWWAAMETLHVDGPDGHARQDYFMLRMALTAVEGHPLAGYFCDGRPSPEAVPHFRFGTRANIAVQSGSMAPDGSLVAPFADGVGDFPGEVLFLTGECNVHIGAAHQRAFHLPLFDKAELVEIPGAGHMMFGEQQDETLEVLRRYLAEPEPEPEPTEPELP